MAVCYPGSKERSAEVLRATLRLMGQHEARWNPITFTVWYEYAAGMNQRLNHAIEERLRARPVLGDDEVLRLYRDHIAEPDQETMQKISGELQRVMSGVAENASSTGEQATTFGEQIDHLAGALKRADPAELSGLLEGAASSALNMKGTSLGLVQQISEGQLEIERPRADLDRARDEALIDPLTRALNRRGFDAQLCALMRPAQGARPPNSLVMIDIDHFKAVNDTHGHVAGDQVIQALAEALRSCIPEAGRLVARYGGEEFAILLPETRIDEGARVAEAMRQRVRAMTVCDRRKQDVVISVTVSAGVAEMRAGDDASSWIARADAALYRSKQKGRDRVTRA